MTAELRDTTDDAASLVSLGAVLHRQKRFAEAIDCFERALAVRPRHPDVLSNLGNTHLEQGDTAAAAGFYRRALAAWPDHVGANFGLGIVLQRSGELEAAVAHYQCALRIDPEHAGAYLNQGAAYRALGKLEAAVGCYRQAVAFRPGDAACHFNLGTALNMLQETAEAAACHRRALELDPCHPGAWSDLGNALLRQGEMEEAVECHRRAIALAPDWAGAHANLGVTLVRMHRMDEALACFDRALELAPDDVFVHFNQSNARLLMGDYEHGYALYEYHRKVYPPRFKDRRWEGDDLGGRTLLLHAQHGLGDTLQFVRYVPVVAASGGRIVLQVQDALKPLLAGVTGAAEIRGWSEPVPEFDVQATLLELPAILGHTLETIPRRVPYLRADPELRRRWARRLAGDSGFKVGIVWQGNPRQRDGLHRSCTLADYAPLAAVPGVRLYSLQKGGGSEQLAAPGSRFEVTDFGDALDATHGAYMDTAAIMESLDLVISIDTSICHLAGGLARPTWLLLPYWVDWRWLLDRSDSPWYPTLRLFRQERPFDWAGVFVQVEAALRQQVAAFHDRSQTATTIDLRDQPPMRAQASG